MGNYNLHGRNIVELPEDLSINILLRLSIGDLVRFGCVDKSCLSFLSNPKFVEAILSREEIIFTTFQQPIATHSNNNNSRRYTQFSIDTEGEVLRPTQHLDFARKLCGGLDPQRFFLACSCDGLLLFNYRFPRSHPQLYICNPLIPQIVELPANYSRDGCNWALVHNTRINRYQIYGISSSQRKILMLTQGETTWFQTDVPIRSSNRLFNTPLILAVPLFSNKELHWLTTDADEGGNQEETFYFIFSIHIEIGIMGRTKFPLFPVTLERFEQCSQKLSEVNGSLCLIYISDSTLDFFLLEDRDTCKWIKYHTVTKQSLTWGGPGSFLPSFQSDISFVPSRQTDSSEFLGATKILLHHGDDLFLCDLGTKRWRRIGSLSKDEQLCTPSVRHSYSLVRWV